uniref:Cytochrome c oxidase subunit 1 n=1 Tax=Hydatigena taeniaeformis TaxID=6205 RepID=A0A0R3WYD2_HYDTA
LMKLKCFRFTYFDLLVVFVIFDLEISLLLNMPTQGLMYWSFIGLLIRVKFLEPYYKVIPLDCYNFLVTNHGIIMIFFFLMPILIGGFVVSMYLGAGIGWTFYPPLSSSLFSESIGVDFLMFSLHLAGASRIFMTNIFSRTSIVLWSYLFTSILLLVTLPVLAAAITMLLFDNKFSSAFFDPLGGGD